MATVGTALTTPETGWRRYDNTDSNMTYDSGSTWNFSGGISGDYMGTSAISNTAKCNVKFNFKGTKLRFISWYATNRSTSIDVIIDGAKVGNFSLNYATPTDRQILAYEITGLQDTIHYIKFVHVGTGYFVIDAVDIDDTGELQPYNNLRTKTSFNSLQIGDYIPCTYVAGTSGAIGVFSNLGVNSGVEIPVAGSATPNGLFYWIFVGYDTKGRMKLIADRNIQNAISWDAINTAGIAVGSGLPIYFYTGDLCSTGTAIAYADTGYHPSNSFDNDTAGALSFWFDYDKTGSNVNGVEWIGYDFGASVTKEIRQMTLVQESGSGYSVSSVKIQKSDDNTTWTDVTTASVTQNPGTRVKNTIYLPQSGSARYWRLLANSATSNYQWRVVEIEMMELSSITTNYNLTTRLLTGGSSSTDNNTEWDKIIVNYTLNGTITAGDNNIWNWSGVSSWTSTTPSSSNKSIRGNTLVSTFASAGTATLSASSTGFRPVLLVEKLIEPLDDTITIFPTITHNNDITINGTIFDPNNGKLQYKILLNGMQIYPNIGFTNLANSPLVLDYIIPRSSLVLGSNIITITYQNDLGIVVTKTYTVMLNNQSPIETISVDRNVFFTKPINLLGSITDEDNDILSYRIIINSELYQDWSSGSISPISLNDVISLIADSIIEIDFTDNLGGSDSKIFNIYHKLNEITHVDSNNEDVNYLESYNYISATQTLLATLPLDLSLGYVLQGYLNLNILSGALGEIRIGLIRSFWRSDSVTYSNSPELDSNYITYTPTSTGINIINITALLNKLYSQSNYGLYISTDNANIQLDIKDNDITIDYQPTLIVQPPVVYGNRCYVAWDPVVWQNESNIESISLYRATQPDFSDELEIFNTPNLTVLGYHDTSLSYGTYYYRLKVNFLDLTSPSIITAISIPVPNPGFKNVLTDPVNVVYTLEVTDGLAFDDLAQDHNFYTTADRIKLRALDMGTMIGGRQQSIFGVCIENTYNDKNFLITLRGMTLDGIVAEELESYGRLYDASSPNARTKIELGTDLNNFNNLVYPLEFNLNAGQTQNVFIRINPSIFNTVGVKQIQLKLTGKPI